MILSAQSIRQRSKLVTPFCERTIHSSGLSYGLSSAGYDVRLGTVVNLPPRAFVLGSTLERFELPADLMMRIHDKSTWVRRGLFVQNTVAEPGWRGYLTLEISNETKEWIYLDPGVPIAQVVFEQLDEPTQQAYSGKYQDQAAGPQPARFDKKEISE